MPISWKKKINSCWWLKNDDDPVPPAWFVKNKPHWYRMFMWYLRNPLHNFTFYVIGIADKQFESYGKRPDTVFVHGWDWAVRKYKWLRLPFISYQGHGWQFYIGWRDRGNFGVKLRRISPH